MAVSELVQRHAANNEINLAVLEAIEQQLQAGEVLEIEKQQMLVRSLDGSEPATSRFPDLADLLEPNLAAQAIKVVLQGQTLPRFRHQPSVQADRREDLKQEAQQATDKYLRLSRLFLEVRE